MTAKTRKKIVRPAHLKTAENPGQNDAQPRKPTSKWFMGLLIQGEVIAYSITADNEFVTGGVIVPSPMDADNTYRKLFQQAAGVGRLVSAIVQQPSTYDASISISAVAHSLEEELLTAALLQTGAVAVASSNPKLRSFAVSTFAGELFKHPQPSDGPELYLRSSRPVPDDEWQRIVQSVEAVPEALRPNLRAAITVSIGGKP